VAPVAPFAPGGPTPPGAKDELPLPLPIIIGGEVKIFKTGYSDVTLTFNVGYRVGSKISELMVDVVTVRAVSLLGTVTIILGYELGLFSSDPLIIV
jgi:hypothetical protein